MLTLILQTQEGHQIELDVQPEDTFADLKRQYADHGVSGLSDSLEQIITNGANVAENTKILDFVTGSAHEWYSTNTVDDVHRTEFIETESKIRGCCARGCSNNEITTPGKLFFPLPTDLERLALCLNDIERPDLCNRLTDLDAEECPKYFLCSNHISQKAPLPIVDVAVDQRLSLLKPKNDRPKSNLIEESTFTKENDNVKGGTNDKELPGLDFDIKDSLLELFDCVANSEQPESLCRLCGKIAANPTHLYAAKEENAAEEFNLADKINLCLPVTITITDPLPKQICQDCNVKLDVCHDLALSCLRAEDELRTLLRDKRLCTNVDGVEGETKIIKKCCAYRKENLNDIISTPQAEKIALPVENLKNVFPNGDVQLPTLNDIICESTEMENLLEAPLPSEIIPLSLPNTQFSYSDCSPEPEAANAIKTHNCHPENRISALRCIICKDARFTNPEELEAHCSRHNLSDDKSVVRFDGSESREINGYENWKINCKNEEDIFPNDETSNDDDSPTYLTNENMNHSENTSTHSSKKSKSLYACHFCEKKFTRKSNLKNHIAATHGDNPMDFTPSRCYKCRTCCEAFSREADAQNHLRLKHFSSFLNENMETEKSEYFIEQLFVTCLYMCEFCEHTFTTPSSLHEHRESEHSNTVKYSCALCDTAFQSHRQLAFHKNLVMHKNPMANLDAKIFYVCKYCDKTFPHHSSHSSHLSQHRDTPRPYNCRICNIYFTNYRQVAEHRDEKHLHESTMREKCMYNCQYCQKQFSQGAAFMKHMKIHTGERRHKCTICGKKFSQSSGLRTHLKIHSDLRPYSCTKCPRTFKIKGDRDNHIKKHAGHRPYKCEFCNKAFMTQHVYSQHRKIHTDERPYKCDICDQAFRRSHVLTVHMRRHTGEKPHVCDLCPKTYRQRGDLSKHRRIHHGISNITNTNRVFSSNNSEDNKFEDFDEICKLTDIREFGDSFLLPI